jgi:hypothetical protein
MKQWFKIIVKDAEGWLEGTEFIKAETEQEAIAEIKDNWIDYPYTDEVEESTLEADSLTYKEQAECDHRDAVAAFVADNCTKAEAEKYIKAGSEAIKASELEQYIKDNDLRDEDGELLTAEAAREELDARLVTVDGEEYYLVYVL